MMTTSANTPYILHPHVTPYLIPVQLVINVADFMAELTTNNELWRQWQGQMR